MSDSPIVCVVAEDISNVSNSNYSNYREDMLQHLAGIIENFDDKLATQKAEFNNKLTSQKAEFDDKFRIGALDILVCIIFIIIIVLVIVHIFVEH